MDKTEHDCNSYSNLTILRLTDRNIFSPIKSIKYICITERFACYISQQSEHFWQRNVDKKPIMDCCMIGYFLQYYILLCRCVNSYYILTTMYLE